MDMVRDDSTAGGGTVRLEDSCLEEGGSWRIVVWRRVEVREEE